MVTSLQAGKPDKMTGRIAGFSNIDFDIAAVAALFGVMLGAPTLRLSERVELVLERDSFLTVEAGAPLDPGSAAAATPAGSSRAIQAIRGSSP